MKAPVVIQIALVAGALKLGAQTVPDFRLPDVNPTSPRHEAMVSPRDYRLQVSGYYFGASY